MGHTGTPESRMRGNLHVRFGGGLLEKGSGDRLPRWQPTQPLDRTASLGLHYVEAFPCQQFQAGSPLRLNEELPAAARRELSKRLSDQGLTLVNFGVGS